MRERPERSGRSRIPARQVEFRVQFPHVRRRCASSRDCCEPGRGHAAAGLDWLDEHGQHIRAEFIRVQIEVARVETLPRIILNRYVDLFKRQQELFDNHREELLGPLAGLPEETKVEFHRGFVAEMTLHVLDLVASKHLLAGAPCLPRVTINSTVGYVRHFIEFNEHYDDPELLRSLVSAIVTVPSDDPDEDDEFARNPVDLLENRWPRIEQLDISALHLGDSKVEGLLRSDSFPILADLDFSENDLTDASVTSLLDSGLPPRLKRLILGGNPIGNLGAIELTERWPTGPNDRLEHLNLRFTNIGQPGQQAVLARFGAELICSDPRTRSEDAKGDT